MPRNTSLAVLAELEGSVGPIYSLAWSPDGSILATSGYGQVMLWDPDSDEEPATLDDHTGVVWGVAWSPDGGTLASASTDGTVRLWDAETGQQSALLEAEWPYCVAWSPSGEQLAAGTATGNVVVWDVETGRQAFTLKGTPDVLIISVAWSPDGQALAMGQWNGVLRVWDVASRTQRDPLVASRTTRSDVNGLGWSPDGTRLASAHQDGRIRLWDVAAGSVAGTLERHGGWARGVAWSPDGRLLATTGQDGVVKVWDAATGDTVSSVGTGSQPLWSVAWEPNGHRLAAGSGQYQVKVPGGTAYLLDASPLTADTASPSAADQAAAQEISANDATPPDQDPQLKLTILYDNTAYDPRLSPQWGFSALVEYEGHTLLFDTGGDGPTLLGNAGALGIDLQPIEMVVLSHEHGDHTGGLQALLDQGIAPTVYVPAAFPPSIKDAIRDRTRLVEVTGPLEILPGVHSTGQMGSDIVEQGLVIDTSEGPIVITGCAHPGIVEMVRRAVEILEGDIALVVGGFHLGNMGRGALESIIDGFRQLGVRQVSPTHCTGATAIAMFAAEYGGAFVQGGAGRVIVAGARPTAVSLPTFEAAECQFQHDTSHRVECGYLLVPEKHSQPDNGRTVRLHVAIFKSTSPRPKPDPVIYLSGAGNQLDSHDRYLYAGGDDILRDRDYIMYNQRGARYSDPTVDCRDLTGLAWGLAGTDLISKESDDKFVERLRDCHNDLLAQGIDLTAYNTVENAADVNDLRAALGYEQFNLYGTSYGSRLALTVMRYYPGTVRSAILDSVFPPDVNLFSDDATNIHRAFQQVLETCAADATCSEEYPGLELTFYKTIDDLNADPVSVPLDLGTVLVDGDLFLTALYLKLFSAGSVPRVPRWIDRASQRRFDDQITRTFESVMDWGGAGLGTFWSVHCNEEISFDSYDSSRAKGSSLPPQIGNVFDRYMDFAVCEFWQSGLAGPVENTPVASDIPSLILAGQFDPVTPPAWGMRAAETLSNSFFYQFPGLSHGIMRSDDCGLSIGLQFLADPATRPDASCIDALPVPEFE
jgi:metal-dependent hydrolase (beta-lactamase superfamily II)/pimeloyl-ACP methyl ester carboxylesterase/Tol biopolymer transport system component